jgi:hypothetical protein
VSAGGVGFGPDPGPLGGVRPGERTGAVSESARDREQRRSRQRRRSGEAPPAPDEPRPDAPTPAAPDPEDDRGRRVDIRA